jgi:hypothetical protein
MQLASGCAIGTAIGLGEGFLKSWVAILFAIAGATLATWNPVFDWLQKLPKTSDRVTLPWYASAAIVAALLLILIAVEVFRAYGRRAAAPPAEYSLQDAQVLMTLGYDQEREERRQPGYRLRLVRNYVIDIAIAALLGLFFLCEGNVMAVVPALAEAGSWIMRTCGVDTMLWHYWSGRPMPSLLKSDAFLGTLFITLGAFVSSAMSGNFGLFQEFGVGDAVKAAVGGLAMGFGGVVAGGGNLLAGVGGIASSSVDGLVWIGCAVLGALAVVATEMCTRRTDPKREIYADLG